MTTMKKKTVKIIKCTAKDNDGRLFWYHENLNEEVMVEEFEDWGMGKYFFCPKYEGLILKKDTRLV